MLIFFFEFSDFEFSNFEFSNVEFSNNDFRIFEFSNFGIFESNFRTRMKGREGWRRKKTLRRAAVSSSTVMQLDELLELKLVDSSVNRNMTQNFTKCVKENVRRGLGMQQYLDLVTGKWYLFSAWRLLLWRISRFDVGNVGIPRRYTAEKKCNIFACVSCSKTVP